MTIALGIFAFAILFALFAVLYVALKTPSSKEYQHCYEPDTVGMMTQAAVFWGKMMVGGLAFVALLYIGLWLAKRFE